MYFNRIEAEWTKSLCARENTAWTVMTAVGAKGAMGRLRRRSLASRGARTILEGAGRCIIGEKLITYPTLENQR